MIRISVTPKRSSVRGVYHLLMAEFETLVIRDALRQHGRSPTHAAQALGIPLSTLKWKLKRLAKTTKHLDAFLTQRSRSIH
jgi:DNA-binding NtrC family response regulator